MTDPDPLADRTDVTRSEQVIALDPGEFETVRENVAAGRDRWVGALVRDGDGRIVLVRNRWSDGWVLPGGTVERDESLREAVVREVREETGLDATVERPLEVVEQTFGVGSAVAEETTAISETVATDETTATGERAVSGGPTATGHFVVFEASASGPELGDDLGRDDDEIADARWFGSVPAECEHDAVLTRHL